MVSPFDVDYVAGVCLAANAVPGIRFLVDAERQAILNAVEAVLCHDWFSALNVSSQTFWSGTLEPSLPEIRIAPSTNCRWWQGFSDALEGLAAALPLAPPKPTEGHVALIGFPLDRLEPDRLADLADVKTLLEEGLGLKVVSVWPCGKDLDLLFRVREAGWLLAFPYGVAAAKILSKRLLAKVLEVPLPVGLGGTILFLKQASSVIDSDPTEFIESSLKRYAPRLEWIIPYRLLNLSVFVESDPALEQGLVAWLRELGCVIVSALDAEPDLVVGPGPVAQEAIRAGCAFLEFGFPTPNSHAFAHLPARFGFEAAMNIVTQIVGRLTQWEVVRKALSSQRG